jgi:hypothetical protein
MSREMDKISFSGGGIVYGPKYRPLPEHEHGHGNGH